MSLKEFTHSNEFAVLSRCLTNRLNVNDENSDDDEEEYLLKNIHFFMFIYADCDISKNLMLAVVQDIDQLIYAVDRRPYTCLIAEVCGGEARTTQLAVRQKYKTGPSFDLVCDIYLTKYGYAQKAYYFFDRNTVLVAVMAPICACFGPMGHMNWEINPESMERLYKIAKPIAQFCGFIAELQLRKGLHFIQEQPSPSGLYDEKPWPR